MNSKINVKNNKVTIENLQELTNLVGINFQNLVVRLTNEQITSLNYLFIIDMNTNIEGEQIETLLLNSTTFGLNLTVLGNNGKYLTSYTIYQIASITNF